MSGYSGRRPPNVSEYIQNLNQIPSAADLAAQQPQAGFEGLDEDLAPFMNTEFFDYDASDMANPPISMPFDAAQARQDTVTTQNHNPGFDFLNNDFQFNEFPDLPTVVPDAAAAAIAAQGNGFPQQFHSPTPTTSASPSLSQVSQGTKRKVSEAMSPPNGGALEEQSRLAAEEDKRRRNTAASARFRVKKKQREQALEKTAKDMTEKVSSLEARINQLEMENKWLKGLITEKNDAKNGVGELKEKFKAGKEAEKAERSLDTRKDGVGTVKTEKA